MPVNPVLYMLVGLPGSGKSTWTEKQFKETYLWSYKYSTDAIIKQIANSYGISYNDGFRNLYSFAEQINNKELIESISKKLDIYWDQTNTTKKSRAKKLANFPSCYKKIAVIFTPISDEAWKAALASRKDKHIPQSVIDTMQKTYETPTFDEGFDEIIQVTTEYK